MEQLLVPMMCKIDKVIQETPDIRTYRLKFKEEGLMEKFDYKPGQFVELSLLGAGECTFCISSSVTRKGYFDCSIKRAGNVTSDIHNSLEEGDEVGIRGPFGNWFPLEELKGKNLLIVGGGIGLAPLRSLIQYCIDNRNDYKDFTILYGSRTSADLCYKEETKEWQDNKSLNVILTIDKAEETWTSNVGVVPKILEEVVKPVIENTKVITCGPPIMIKYTIQSLKKLGFADKDIITTLEMKMQCGLGKCGRCNIGSTYVCKDGPVFTNEQLKNLPDEF
ncbi:MAG: FAD/NAD(P)-binding protein [Bacteroidales bacterium]|nr:FAD/NAD(P)-binding protein [Bacteroidales bacterium]MDD4603165.1 FAD/NAD(P)-binding protein [Bacteroidales bacterium]